MVRQVLSLEGPLRLRSRVSLRRCAAALALLALLGPTRPAGAAGLSLDAVPPVVVQGQALRVRVHAAGALAAVRLTVGGVRVPLHRRGRDYEAFAGTTPTTKPRMLEVRIAAVVGGRRLTARAGVRVRTGRFGVRRLRVPPALLDPALVAAERRRVAAALAAPLLDPLWSGAFRRPLDGAVTSAYGTRSIYNGVTRGYHLGVDLRAAAGTPVAAAQHGRVVLAEGLPLSGNTVILDHGGGIVTTYQHLSRVAVRPGSRVARGQIVGFVGSTGLSTGPHLHWGMRINGVRVNPLDWTAPGPLTLP
jgi:murein DD-endopeptidase MepM/ murein hydrolase activator NlpD